MEDEIFTGVINYMKTTGLVTLNKKWQKRWAALYTRSAHGIPRLELYDSKDSFDKREKNVKKHTVSLEKCSNIVKDQTNDGKKIEYLLRLSFTDEKQQVISLDAAENLEDWYSCITSAVFGGSAGVENISPDVMFEVEIKKSEVTEKLNLHGSFFLSVSPEDINLLEKRTKKSLIKWPLHLLRKYGRDRQEFSLEAGRRCPSGQGMFFFITDEYNAIFQEVENNVKSLARDRAPSTSSTTNPLKFTHPIIKHSPSADTTLPASPRLSPGINVYADPVDARREGKTAPSPDGTYTYNEPVNTKTPPISLKPIGTGKKSKDHKKTIFPTPFNQTMEGPMKPPRKTANSQAPEIDPEATYSEATYTAALPGNTNGDDMGFYSEYSHLVIGSNNPEADYDSLSLPSHQWNSAAPAEDAAYATTSDYSRFTGRNAQEDSVYDHVQR